MMSEVILKEVQTVGIAFASGALITFLYDLLRIFRRVISHGNVWIGVEDFLFWIWTSLWIFSVLYRTNDGSLRIYTILAMVFGMVVYHKSISEQFVRLAAGILRKLTKILGYPLKQLKNLCKEIIIKKNR